MTDGDQEAFESIAKQFDEPTEEAKRAEAEMRLRERLTATIERLDQEKLGKPVVMWVQPKLSPAEPDQTDAARLASAIERSNERLERKLIGYTLPVTPDDLKHITILNNGSMVATEARRGSEEMYKRNFSPSEDPHAFGEKSLDAVKGHLMSDPFSNTVLTNDSEENLPKLYEMVGQATETARDLRLKREQIRIDSATHSVEMLERLFAEPAQPQQAQTEPPQQPPTPPTP